MKQQLKHKGTTGKEGNAASREFLSAEPRVAELLAVMRAGSSVACAGTAEEDVMAQPGMLLKCTNDFAPSWVR